MRKLLAALPAVLLALTFVTHAQEKKAPEKLTFKAKTGDVVFNHEAHVKREKNDCKVCHDKLWPQNTTAPLNFKLGMHKPAEAKKTSCGACHHVGGASFTTTGNCKKCHGNAGAASKG